MKITSIESKRPHLAGEAICLQCRHKWTAVCPVGVAEMECPECGLFRGVYVYNCVPEQEVWSCKCGNYHFAITQKNIVCVYCGISQTFPEI